MSGSRRSWSSKATATSGSSTAASGIPTTWISTPETLAEGRFDRACANALAVDSGMFKSQVLAYLEPADQSHSIFGRYGDTAVLEVVYALNGNRP
jgi:hypothetical protein